MWYCAICLVRTSDQCDCINRLFSASGAFYLTVVITSERLSHLTALSSVLDNYMTTHFLLSIDDFIWSFHAKLGNVQKKFRLNRIFF